MFGIRLDDELEQRLNALAKRENRSKAYLIRHAILRFVREEEARSLDLKNTLVRIDAKRVKEPMADYRC